MRTRPMTLAIESQMGTGPRSSLSFAEWMKAVDRTIQRMSGLSYLDLPDCPYHDWWTDECGVARAAKRAIQLAND